MRRALAKEWSLKPADAIHLATADHLKVVAFDTYDEPLFKMSEITDTRFQIGPPLAVSPSLPMTGTSDQQANASAKKASDGTLRRFMNSDPIPRED